MVPDLLKPLVLVQITSAADSEAVTRQKLVKGHAYSLTGAVEVRRGLGAGSAQGGGLRWTALKPPPVPPGELPGPAGEAGAHAEPVGPGGVDRRLERRVRLRPQDPPGAPPPVPVQSGATCPLCRRSSEWDQVQGDCPHANAEDGEFW